ncbi:DUF3987 domain-containing protein [Prevotella communis]|uniref:DUF3987 domain-containing protein n=1 Tax=Prevotella communis TaxID=2913614 RepID=UPI001EDBB8E4|nr:DUF3987 domain-containing protein [Prevotella communis]UKK63543.1 DUF3987 domain-containing protein [Prevotella communis]UKK66370.1 DUF3987 domain-containing protein [Prevotella communis]
MNYSCLPNEDGSLKGSKTMSTTVGMDIDHLTKEEMPAVRERILQKKEELGLLMLEESARGGGYHLVFRRRPELSQEENLKWASELLEVKYDDGAKDITRVFFTTTGSAEDLLFLDDEIFRLTPSPSLLREGSGQTQGQSQVAELSTPLSHREGMGESLLSTPLPHREGMGESLLGESLLLFPSSYHGIPFTDIIRKYWELNNHGFEPTIGDRDTLTYQLACDLRHICGKNADWLDQVIPCYNGFPEEEKRAKIKSALSSEYNGFPQRLRNTLNALTSPDLPKGEEGLADEDDSEDAVANSSLFTLPSSLKRMPMGIRDSIDAVGPQLSMPVITAICPCIGTLATGVTLDVHGQKRGLNLIAYIAGDFASGKGGIDPVVEAWMSEVQALDKMYQVQEDEWRAKKRAAKNKKEQPEEPKLPVRCLTLNNTVANLAERLANTEGKHAFSFTPEADTVAQKWKSTMSDFSVMLRQSYDGTKYEREARSADAVNVHIDKLLWNVCMCGTPDALYRVVNNYTDGFQSRIAVARTPDNTFAPLQDKPPVLTDRQRDRIQQIAHLLPLMYGEVVLPKLEAKGREWVERIRLETMKNDDRTRARQRFRVCVTAQRMTCCLMLCKVCESLIQKHGLTGAEAQLKQQPGLWKEMLLKAQTLTMLEVYDVIADSLLENALYFFRDRIENAFQSRDYAGNMNGERTKRGKNDSIFERLDIQFSFEQAMQQSVAVKGANVNHNTVRQMLKNWRKQKLVVLEEDGKYRKV